MSAAIIGGRFLAMSPDGLYLDDVSMGKLRLLLGGKKPPVVLRETSHKHSPRKAADVEAINAVRKMDHKLYCGIPLVEMTSVIADRQSSRRLYARVLLGARELLADIVTGSLFDGAACLSTQQITLAGPVVPVSHDVAREYLKSKKSDLAWARE
jgi:hypothetical protein